MQFVAPFGDETILFRLAAQLDTTQPWANHRTTDQRKRFSSGRKPGGWGICEVAESDARALFYSGSVLKADDLDGPLALVDAIVNQIISVNEFQNTEAPFYFGPAIRHVIKAHRKIDKFETCFLRRIRVVSA